MADPRARPPDHQVPCLGFPSCLLLHHLSFRRKPWRMPMEKRSERRRLLGYRIRYSAAKCSQPLDAPALPRPRPAGVQLPVPVSSQDPPLPALWGPSDSTHSTLSFLFPRPTAPAPCPSPSQSPSSDCSTICLCPCASSFASSWPDKLLLILQNPMHLPSSHPWDHIKASAAAPLTSAAALSVQSLSASLRPLKGRDDVISTLDPWCQHRLDTQWEKRHI